MARNPKEIYGVVERNPGGDDSKACWTRIGTGFKNKDGAINLLFDFVPTNARTTIQLRDQHPEESDAPQQDASV